MKSYRLTITNAIFQPVLGLQGPDANTSSPFLILTHSLQYSLGEFEHLSFIKQKYRTPKHVRTVMNSTLLRRLPTVLTV